VLRGQLAKPSSETTDDTQKRSGQVICESADELMIRPFAGSQRDGIGRFCADPMSGRWVWSDAAYEVFGYRAGSVAPSWNLIISHVPSEDRAVAQAAHDMASTRIGSFSWSHRIHVGGTTRSILLVGETSAIDRGNSARSAVPRRDQPKDCDHASADLHLEGYVIDLTELLVAGARQAATEAVQNSAQHRAVIEQAKGVLMLAFRLDADTAFALLAWHSQSSNRKVRAIAADLIAHVLEDGLSGHHLRLAMDRILTNGDRPKKRRARIPH
jgi:hypothetical protein